MTKEIIIFMETKQLLWPSYYLKKNKTNYKKYTWILGKQLFYFNLIEN